jgi:FecR protein
MKSRMFAARFIFLAFLCLPAIGWAASAGTITHLSGLLFVTHANGTQKLLSVKSEVLSGDTLRTEVDTYARIKFLDGSEVVLRPQTIFRVDSYTYNEAQKEQDNFLTSLIKGGLRSVTGLLGKRNPNRFKLQSTVATIGIRGTHFGALLCNNDCGNIQTVNGGPPPNGLHTDTAEGTTVISNSAGFIVVPAGSFSYTANAFTAPKLVPPGQGIQVTMPTSISFNKGNGGGLDSKKSCTCKVQ